MDSSSRIAQALKNNKAVITPTDTVWGILSLKKELIKKIKKRNENSHKKIVQFIYDINQMGFIPDKLVRLLNACWPGPLTIIYNEKSYRIPDNIHILKALKQINAPVYASSANITEKPTIRSIKEAKETFKNFEEKIEFIDGILPNTTKYKASTVYNYDTQQIVREGPISEASILKFLGN